ncbi:lipoyl synthase [Thiomicrolovo sp. ZZH C-3]
MPGTMTSFERKPAWLRKPIRLSRLAEVEAVLARGKLHTICQEAACPNIGECFAKKTATFLILGTRCTRACTFCNVSRGVPDAPDPEEPGNIALTVQQLGLRHVVITAPTRDDLHDGGAEHFVRTVGAIKRRDKTVRVELLIPDLRENGDALARIARSGAEILGHNLETVPRLYHVRKGASYARSLRVLERLAALAPGAVTKSGIMLGFGERDAEVLALMRDLRDSGCGLLSIGQYLSPSPRHAPVTEYVDPARFDFFKQAGMAMGFRYVMSSPYTRSSYLAHQYLEER